MSHANSPQAPPGYFKNLHPETGPDQREVVRPQGFFSRKPKNTPGDIVPILSETDVQIDLERDEHPPTHPSNSVSRCNGRIGC